MYRKNENTSPKPRVARHGMTLLELILAMTIIVMVIGAMGGLAKTVQQGYEYSEGYGIATQHARVVLDRIAQNVSQATVSKDFPGCIVVSDSVDGEDYPDTLVVWRPTGLPANPTGLPLYCELVLYCPHPDNPGQFVQIKAPSDNGTVPPVSDTAGWQTNLASLKKASSSEVVELSSLLHKCRTSAENESDFRGAARFEVRLKPSDADWTDKSELRQVWVRMELQFVPGVEWVSSNQQAAQPVPFFGSATRYYNIPPTE